MMLPDVKRTILYGLMRHNAYVELSRQNNKDVGGLTMGNTQEGHVRHPRFAADLGHGEA